MDQEQKTYVTNSIAQLERYLNDYSDDIPTHMIHSATPYNRYKVRAAWINMVAARIENLALRNLLSKELEQKNIAWLDSYEQNREYNGHRTSREDIVAGNNLIKETLTYLKSL